LSMSLPLWMSVEPTLTETRLQLCEPSARSRLRARLPPSPDHPRAVLSLMEAMALWSGAPLHAVVDVDAAAFRRDPERWAMLLGDANEHCVRVHYVSVQQARRARRDRFLSPLGDFAHADRLVSLASAGVLR
jgi:hypothetical protein